jgi:hypothetical protein
MVRLLVNKIQVKIRISYYFELFCFPTHGEGAEENNR